MLFNLTNDERGLVSGNLLPCYVVADLKLTEIVRRS